MGKADVLTYVDVVLSVAYLEIVRKGTFTFFLHENAIGISNPQRGRLIR